MHSLRGELLDRDVWLDATGLSTCANISGSVLVEMVEVGILDPGGTQPEQWRFTSRDLRRLRSALRLTSDLDINLAGAALVLDLLEERESLRERLHVLERVFESSRE